MLKQKSIAVVECDQPAAIHKKQQVSSRRWPKDDVIYVPIDLNDVAWPIFKGWLDEHHGVRILVMMEGVCAYVNRTSFESFLGFLGHTLAADSVLAYDYKIANVDDDFGRAVNAKPLFRLTADTRDVAAFHQKLGFRLDHFEQSFALSERLLPGLVTTAQPLFREDCLIRLTIDSNV